MQEFRAAGFQGASLNRILAHTGLTKGALYHYFPSKQALGYAVVDELIVRPLAAAAEALQRSDDPIATLRAILRAQILDTSSEELALGCPFHRLTQEMFNQDEGFKARLQGLHMRLHGELCGALRRGQRDGLIRLDVDVEGVAGLFIATRNGLLGMARHCPDRALVERATQQFLNQLAYLQAEKEHPCAS